jgi:DNA-binding transcriptional LysR family regulator
MDHSDAVLRRLKLSDLRMLEAVAQRGSMARAASSLSISQPAISKAIAALERTLNVRLLDRTPTGVEPTIYGRALLNGGNAVFDELRQSVKQIRHMADPGAGEVRIGCNQPHAIGVISVAIERLNQKHPRIRVLLEEADTATLKQRELRGRRVDMIFARSPIPCPEPDMEAEGLFNDQLRVVVGKDSPWARRRAVRLADLAGEQWSMPPYDSVVGGLIREAFLASDVALPEPALTTHSVHMVVNIVKTGRYVCIMPDSMLRFRAGQLGLKVLPVSLPHRPSAVAIMTLKNRTLSPLAKVFIEAARELTQPLAGST